MNFVTLFPHCENIHLKKDVGSIPYTLSKEYGYNSKIVTYENGTYEYLDKFKPLKIEFMKKWCKYEFIDSLIYLLRKSREIDVLQLYHFGLKSLVLCNIYKILNNKGISYIKMDASAEACRKITNKINVKNLVKRLLLKKCDIVSVETKEFYKYLKGTWLKKIKYIPNGDFKEDNFQRINWIKKENLLLTVGRIGTYQKANHILLEAFAEVCDKIGEWELLLIGPISDEFNEYINMFYSTHPNLLGRVKFLGPIYDEVELTKYYRRAKIFCLSSRFEGFPLVFLEALKHGCFIISSDFPAAYDVTNNEQLGIVYKENNSENLAQALIEASKKENASLICNETQDFFDLNYNWINICYNIDKIIKSI